MTPQYWDSIVVKRRWVVTSYRNDWVDCDAPRQELVVQHNGSSLYLEEQPPEIQQGKITCKK